MKIIRIKRGLLRRFGWMLPDSYYISKLYEFNMGYSFDLEHPKSFNEKLQWLKIHDRRPVYTTMVDKVAAKEYVAKIIGEEYIIPTIGVWNSVSDIPWDELPKSFVLKATSGGGGSGVVLCPDKSKLNIRQANSLLKRAQKRNIYHIFREWPYKDVPNRIIAEEMLSGSDSEEKNKELNDYKFFCFNGHCEFFKIDFGRFTDHHANYYDKDCKILPFGEAHFPPLYDYPVHIPSTIPEMISIAERLSLGIPFLRVDLYECKGKIYFGEMTFYPASGMGKFVGHDTDMMLGEKLVLPIV